MDRSPTEIIAALAARGIAARTSGRAAVTEDRQSEARDAEYPPRPGALDTSRATPELYAAVATSAAITTRPPTT
jgi:hypothetical protein